MTGKGIIQKNVKIIADPTDECAEDRVDFCVEIIKLEGKEDYETCGKRFEKAKDVLEEEEYDKMLFVLSQLRDGLNNSDEEIIIDMMFGKSPEIKFDKNKGDSLDKN